jgi:hypothetical protein
VTTDVTNNPIENLAGLTAMAKVTELRSPFAEARARAKELTDEYVAELMRGTRNARRPQFDEWEAFLGRCQRIADDRALGLDTPPATGAPLGRLAEYYLSFLGTWPPPDLLTRVRHERRVQLGPTFNVLDIRMMVIETLQFESMAVLATRGDNPN